jgi:uncharacterized repeat protein (TIGR03803 family)
MRVFRLLLCGLVLTGCSRLAGGLAPLPAGVPNDNPAASSSQHASQPAPARQPNNPVVEQVLYSFQGGNDGADPAASLIDVNGKLYGTTRIGGTGCKNGGSLQSGCGTIFDVSASGTESVLYRFPGGQHNKPGTNGILPAADLLDANGVLYGTTPSGGFGAPSCGFSKCGTVFKVSLSGEESVVDRFHGSPQGAYPYSSLVEVSGTLYGTTSGGGQGCSGFGGCGTVFAVNPSTGALRVVYSFKGGATDGANPLAGLLAVSGTLYGTTKYGGSGTCEQGPGGCGTVFKIDPSTGAESVLHSFDPYGSTDGSSPWGGLIDVHGTLYGTTIAGGTSYYGTVFSVNPSTGAEHVIYNFKGGKDGLYPEAGLISTNRRLYGTTAQGGTGSCVEGYGCGTVFEVDTSILTERVLHRFHGGTDGAGPQGALVDVNGVLYGTTNGGGTGLCGTYYGGTGCGTVFKLTL